MVEDPTVVIGTDVDEQTGSTASSVPQEGSTIPPEEMNARNQAEPGKATGVQFGPKGPSVDIFGKSSESDTEPSVFDIELPETAPVIRIQIGGEKIDVSFWTLFDLCTKYEQEFVSLPWETFAPIVTATLGVKELDFVQWRVLMTNVEHLMNTKLKKNFQIINKANDLQGRNPATSSDSPKP